MVDEDARDAERRAKRAEAARRRRAEVRAERDAERVAARGRAVSDAARTQRDALEASIAAAKWLKDSDGAVVNLARTLARELDYADHMGDDALSLRITGQLAGLLDRLALTPVVRMRHELRSAQLAARAASEAAPPAPATAPPLPANVSKLARPAKRGDGGDRG